MTIFFTADTHFDHKNVIRFCDRPFKSVDEMNEALIKNWNAKVKPQDTIYHLGDFCMASEGQRILDRLNGKKHLVKGNHDKKGAKLNGWESVSDYLEFKHNKQLIVMSHYAMRVWNKSHYGSWMLYGHSHGSLPDDPNAKSFDVGVDCHNYAPLSFSEVKAIMAKKNMVAVDHHGKD